MVVLGRGSPWFVPAVLLLPHAVAFQKLRTELGLQVGVHGSREELQAVTNADACPACALGDGEQPPDTTASRPDFFAERQEEHFLVIFIFGTGGLKTFSHFSFLSTIS